MLVTRMWGKDRGREGKGVEKTERHEYLKKKNRKASGEKKKKRKNEKKKKKKEMRKPTTKWKLHTWRATETGEGGKGRGRVSGRSHFNNTGRT